MTAANPKPLACILAAGLCLAVLAIPPAWATDLANAPMAVQYSIKPNVMLTVDDSGGMDVDVLFPDYNSMYYETGVTINEAYLNGFFYLFPEDQRSSNPSSSDNFSGWMLLGGLPSAQGGDNPDKNSWEARSSAYNPQYYNPAVTYKPWPGVNSSGQAYTNASPTAAYLDPYNPSLRTVNGSTTVNLTSTINYYAYTYLTTKGKCINSGCTSYRQYSTSLYWATYYDASGKCYQPGAPSSVTSVTGCSATSFPSGRSATDELQNFANWFQYDRTVMLALKGAVGVDLGLMQGARVGMTDLASPNPLSPIADLSSATNLSNLTTAVYGLDPNLQDWRQPIHERLYNVWNYYNSTGTDAPIQRECQPNYDVLVTPGYLNEDDPGVTSCSSGNAPGFTNCFTGDTPPNISPTNYDGQTGSSDPAWGTAPYTDGWSNTLADWAAFYYDAPLRSDLTPTGKVAIPPNTQETNTNLHMTTFVLAPGAEPELETGSPYLNPMTVNLFGDSSATPAVPATSVPWPQPVFVGQSTVDDLWHAAVDGRGVFVNSSNVSAGVSQMLNTISGRTGAAAAVAVSNHVVTASNNTVYASSYNSGNWSGDLQAYPINITTGAIETSSPVWSTDAQTQLDNLTWTGRAIATYSGSAGIPFTYSALSAASLTNWLDSPVSPPGTGDAQTVINFLRGDRTDEGTLYRTRAHVLGDIVDAEPAYVGAPNDQYSDPGYTSFVSANAARQPMVYQGANDGMLHAINAATGADLWDYVPGLLITTPDVVTGTSIDYSTTSSLVNLTMKTGFTHLYYVDGTPTVGDVDFSSAGTPLPSNLNGYTPNWQTILVGGLNKGGQGYYALNVTSPTASSDAQVAADVLWEFPDSAAGTSGFSASEVGYSFGQPVIVKTAAAGWVVLVTSGYGNADGSGHLFVLNPATGALIKDIAVPATYSTTNPVGLAQIAASAPSWPYDNTVDQVYAGDLQGNVWRFDLSGSTVSSWSVQLLAQLTDPSGSPQPVTTQPEVANIIESGTSYRVVYVGTGEYLGLSDVPNSPSAGTAATQQNTMYALVDPISSGQSTGTGSATTPLLTNLRSTTGGLYQEVISPITGTSELGFSGTAPNPTVVFQQDHGWYLDLPNPDERVVTDPQVALGALIFTTNIPSTDACSPGGASWLYVLDYATGNHLTNSAAAWSAISLGNALSSRPDLVMLPNGTVQAIIRQSNANNLVQQVPTPPSGGGAKLVSWREINTN
ncbi:MAG: PilC/PilY family type IV pilus protein [Betaproteobacteria bacterium]|nr:PilC/PilY family type IV pilus protein [Betaproteobacteria bacterium]